MSKRTPCGKRLISTIRIPPPDKAAQDRELTQAAAKLADKLFRRVWANPADSAYDRR